MDSLSAYIAEYSHETIAVSVVDPTADFAFDINGEQEFHAASTMKVPVMMELYREVAAGALSLDDSLLVKNEFWSIVDGSLFRIEDDSDDVIYSRLGTMMSLRDLNHSMITVSSNLATNLLIDHLGAENVQAYADALGVKKMKILRGVEDLKAYELGLSNTTTSNDLALLLLVILESSESDDAYAANMVETLLDQKFNDLIPSGLPARYSIAHKTGWITGIRHDAAIVYPPDEEPYILVVLTEGFEDQERVEKAIGDIARLVNESIR
ncbi:MAG: serine hydrolase [Rhodothermales bacterium]|nr:serine hydrolase [Rhodothermales bacterium]